MKNVPTELGVCTVLANVANVQMVPVTLLTADVLVDANRDIRRPVIAQRVQFEFNIMPFSLILKR